MAYDVKATEQYIREAAVARGINPDIAVRVARSEGLATGVYQSNLSKGGSREPSYGPFQLLVGGQGTNYPAGMGNDFIARTGLDPRDPSTVPQQVDFALDNAAKNGWGAWYGAKKVGVDRFDGIGGRPSGGAPSTRIAATGDGDVMVYGGAQDDTLGVEPIAPPTNPGGLGGLGGFVRSDSFGDFLGALGTSLLSSPSNAPLAGVGDALTSRQDRRLKQDLIDQERAEKRGQQEALYLALRSQGFTDEQARAYSASASAASVAVEGRQQQQKLALADDARQRDASFLQGLTAPYEPVSDAVPATSGSPAASTPDDLIPVSGEAGMGTQVGNASTPASVTPSSFGTGNTTVDAYMARRARVAAQLANAPSDDAFQRGKLQLDQIDKEIERYAPTGAMKEYAFSMQQRQNQGLPTISFDEWDNAQKKASASTTTINTGEGDKFYENLDRKNAERFAALSDGGQNARGRQAQVNQLDALLKQSPSGSEAAIKTWLGDYGIATDGLDALQASVALIEKMVPEQREPGSGPMSDADIAGFRRSLPRTINQPGGNELIIGRLQAINEYDIARGEIADMVADREISPAEGRKRLRELSNPLAGYSDLIRTLGTDGGGGRTIDMTPRADDGVPIGASSVGPTAPQPASRSEYDALPAGALFRAPDGTVRRKQ